mgnify:CR=1 FL=1
MGLRKKQYTLFYSWQSEDSKGRKLLEAALQKSVETLKDDEGIELTVDHSTLGESGMPSIDQTILRKIDACDIFLADITPVCNYQHTLGNGQTVTKEVPNPNVLVELGYAMSALGVGYVITVAHQGTWVPNNLPFDINHRSIYTFSSSSCDLTSQILEVIAFIKKNGSHRHLDKPYPVYLFEKWAAKLIPEKKPTSPVVCYDESTVLFRKRIANAFPGGRGLVEIKSPIAIYRHLSKLLEKPLRYDKAEFGVTDPIWWFRGGSALDINSFRWLGGRRFLIGWDELKIKRIVAYVENGRYYSNYVYIEADPLKPTGLYKEHTPENVERWKKDLGGYFDEEYAVYKPYWFYRKKITKQEEDDGATKVFGRLVRMKRNHIDTRCRYLTKYNYIIAAKGSTFNCNEFNRTSGLYFAGLLDGSVTMDEFNEYLMKFPKREWEL